MSTSSDFSNIQVAALESMRDLLTPDRWALIGASAIRCRLPLPRPTADIDFVVTASSEAVYQRLREAGWTRHPTKLQTWLRENATVDVIPATEEDLLAGVAHLEDGFVLSIVGFDLAFAQSDLIPIREGLVVPVPRIPVLVLLKMIAWLDRNDREKDLEDLVFMWDSALPEVDPCRWDPEHPLGSADLDYADQSAFCVGWQLGRIAGPEHVHWAKRFLDAMRDEESIAFAQLVRGSRYGGDHVELRLRSRLTAFESGLDVGAAPSGGPATRPVAIRATASGARARSVAWAKSGSLQMLIHDAIDHRTVIHFYGKGLMRVAEPHVLGLKNGRLQVLVRQIGGSTSSGGRLPGWRRFFLSELSGVAITSETFAGPQPTRGRHSHFDRQIAVVRSR